MENTFSMQPTSQELGPAPQGGHRAMLGRAHSHNTTLATTPVRVVFPIYSYNETKDLLTKTRKAFGQPGQKWFFVSSGNNDFASNEYAVEFHFFNPHDATVFALKYAYT